jgi:hypothetical protein
VIEEKVVQRLARRADRSDPGLQNPDGPRLVLARGHLRDLISDVKAGRYDAEL